MLERFGSWLVKAIPAAVAWFDHRPGWLQGILALAAVAVFVVLTHCDELRRAREWAEFRAWQERRRRASMLKRGVIPSGGTAFFWVRYDPPPEGGPRPRLRFSGLTIGERPRLLARISKALRRLMRRLR
jgi:hypothetical protein